MKRNISVFNNLEQIVQRHLPRWIVNTGEMEHYLRDKGINNVASHWACKVDFNDKTIQKAVYINGVLKNRESKSAIPDFVVLDKQNYAKYRDVSENIYSGNGIQNPLKGLPYRWCIEVFGNYFHSGKYVQCCDKAEHEKQTKEAYASIGINVLIIWEDEVDKWEVCVQPKLAAFLELASKDIELPDEDSALIKKPADDEILCWKCLFDANEYKVLSDIQKCKVRELVFKEMRKIDFPYFTLADAKYSWRRFRNWCSGTVYQPTRFGVETCGYFTKSIAFAHAKKLNSDYDLWHNDVLLKKAIEWQLENETGRHSARRFLAAMKYANGFRSVSNFMPGMIARLLKKYMPYLSEGSVIYDPCAGWGGRLVASVGLGYRYRAIDANRKLVGELAELGSFCEGDSVVIYGDSSCEDDVRRLFGNDFGVADAVITSPPYYDAEYYSDDDKQSDRYKTENEWYENFMIPMVRNSLRRLKDNGVAVFIVGSNFRSSVFNGIPDISVDETETVTERGGLRHSERLVVIYKGKRNIIRKTDEIQEQVDSANHDTDVFGKIECLICHRHFNKLGIHLRENHDISTAEYLERFPEAVTKPLVHGKRPSGLHYVSRYKYRLPDGSYTTSGKKWHHEWNGNPPSETKIREDREYGKDAFDGKAEGVDYVVCGICGKKKGVCLTRHIKEHGWTIEHYREVYGAETCAAGMERLKTGANEAWKTRKLHTEAE